MVNILEAKDAQELIDKLNLVTIHFVARIVEAVRSGWIGPDQVGLEAIADEPGCQVGIDGPTHEFSDWRLQSGGSGFSASRVDSI